MLSSLIKTIRSQADPIRARNLAWFFKTKKGEYGYGDQFLGLIVPQIRKLSKQYPDLSLPDIHKLLTSPYHEERLLALLILVSQYPQNPKNIFNFYLQNVNHINNWDLVDLTAPKIVGEYLSDRPRDILYHLAKSENIWEKRIAIISTAAFIKHHDFSDSLNISKILLSDQHDLIHKAVGWMLREVGKRDEQTLINFLKTNYQNIPRTTLRYAIERFSPSQHHEILIGKI